MRYRCLKNDTVVLTFFEYGCHSQHWFDSQLGVQFVLKVATVFTNTRPQSNTPLFDGIVNDSLWEMVPLFDQSFFSTVPRCESGSGRRAAGAHSKLDSQPSLSPGYLAATTTVQWNQEYCETRIPLFPWPDALGHCLAEM